MQKYTYKCAFKSTSVCVCKQAYENASVTAHICVCMHHSEWLSAYARVSEHVLVYERKYVYVREFA